MFWYHSSQFEPLQSLRALDMLCALPQLGIRTPFRRKAGSESLTLRAFSFPIYLPSGRQTAPYGLCVPFAHCARVVEGADPYRDSARFAHGAWRAIRQSPLPGWCVANKPPAKGVWYGTQSVPREHDVFLMCFSSSAEHRRFRKAKPKNIPRRPAAVRSLFRLPCAKGGVTATP